jgi:hypothetical protein
MAKKRMTKIVFRPQKAIIETQTKSGKQRFLTIKKPILELTDYSKNPDFITVATIPKIVKAVWSISKQTVVVFWNTTSWELNEARTRDLMSFTTKISWVLGTFGKTSDFGKRCLRKSIIYNRRVSKKRFGEP